MMLRRYHKKVDKNKKQRLGKENHKELQALTVKELSTMAKEKDIEGYSNLNKKELIEVLEGD